MTSALEFIVCLAAILLPFGIAAAVIGAIYPEEW